MLSKNQMFQTEHIFQIVAQLSGLLRHEIMDFMFADPTMLDDLDFLYKSDTARKLMFYYQVIDVGNLPPL